MKGRSNSMKKRNTNIDKYYCICENCGGHEPRNDDKSLFESNAKYKWVPIQDKHGRLPKIRDHILLVSDGDSVWAINCSNKYGQVDFLLEELPEPRDQIESRLTHWIDLAFIPRPPKEK